jgi:hypothetical protein
LASIINKFLFDFKDYFQFVWGVIKEALVEKVFKNIFATKIFLARLFTLSLSLSLQFRVRIEFHVLCFFPQQKNYLITNNFYKIKSKV